MHALRNAQARLADPAWKSMPYSHWTQGDREEWDLQHDRRSRWGGSEIELVEAELTRTLLWDAGNGMSEGTLSLIRKPALPWVYLLFAGTNGTRKYLHAPITHSEMHTQSVYHINDTK